MGQKRQPLYNSAAMWALAQRVATPPTVPGAAARIFRQPLTKHIATPVNRLPAICLIAALLTVSSISKGQGRDGLRFELRHGAGEGLLPVGAVSTPASLVAAECVGRGAAPASITSTIDFGSRPIQREVLSGTDSGAPASGTVIRFYSNPLILTGDFDSSGSPDTVRAITEVAGPGGTDPCPGGANTDGCFMGERIVVEPYFSSSGRWNIPASFFLARSDASLPAAAPRTFELRFTDAGSYVYHAFSSGGIARYPLEIWDIGDVEPGAPNEADDDRRMAVAVFSDGGGECTFNLDEVTLNGGAGPTVSDRLYAYYFADGFTYADFVSAVDAWVPTAEILGTPLTGQLRPCANGKVGPFGCNGIDLLSYMPKEMLGASSVGLNDLWGWTDSVSGKEYALLCRQDGLSFVDISDPVNPVYVGQLPTAAFASVWRDVKVFGNYAYVVADNAGAGGLQVFDLTRLRNATNIPETFSADLVTNAFIGDAHNIAINTESGFLYGALASGACGRSGIAMVDIRVPGNAEFAGCMLFNNESVQVHDMECVNYRGPDEDYAGREICFTANEQDGMGIADVTDKENALNSPLRTEVATAGYPLLQYAHQGWLTDDHRYFIMGDELDERAFGVNTRTLIWDVTDLDDPQLLTVYEGPTSAVDHNLYVSGNLVYEADYSSGLRVIDISDILNPREVSYFDTFPFDDHADFNGAWTAYPFYASGVVTISSRQEGLFVVRLSPGATARDDDDLETPETFRLSQNYPNPFNPETTIAFVLPRATSVRLALYDLLGREVRVMVDSVLPAGPHSVTLDAGSLSSGTYTYRIEVGDFSASRQLVLLR